MKSRKAQALIEYTLILALVSVVAITVLTTLGKNITNTLGKVSTGLVVAAASTDVPTGHTDNGNNKDHGNGNCK